VTAYRVFWVVDVDADTPEQAARLAREIQLDPTSTATVFDVAEAADFVLGTTRVDVSATLPEVKP
jgi:hypothetical protein